MIPGGQFFSLALFLNSAAASRFRRTLYTVKIDGYNPYSERLVRSAFHAHFTTDLLPGNEDIVGKRECHSHFGMMRASIHMLHSNDLSLSPLANSGRVSVAVSIQDVEFDGVCGLGVDIGFAESAGQVRHPGVAPFFGASAPRAS